MQVYPIRVRVPSRNMILNLVICSTSVFPTPLVEVPVPGTSTRVQGYEYNVQKLCLLITYYFNHILLAKSATSLELVATVASKYAPPTGHSSNMAAQIQGR